MIYELKLDTGKVIEWDGKDPLDAIARFADNERVFGRSRIVIAWREPRHGFFPGVDTRNIIG